METSKSKNSPPKSKKYGISFDNHSIIIGDYSKIIRRLFKYDSGIHGWFKDYWHLAMGFILMETSKSKNSP